jgi:DNA (cytosine-5)-methyltransferase 1
MFKLANDPKSNLIFNTLSYMDEYRPKMAYFENVPGFLTYSLNSTQASIHRVEGGIPVGGLKVVVRALVDLGYNYMLFYCVLAD